MSIGSSQPIVIRQPNEHYRLARAIVKHAFVVWKNARQGLRVHGSSTAGHQTGIQDL